MDKLKIKITDIDAYHNSCPDHLKNTLEQLRHTIKQAAPMATETISYGMPAFKQNKVLVYYAAYKQHIGFYPTPKPIVHFKEDLKKYNTSNGAIQFPIDIPLPLTLIKKIVKFRVEEDKDTSKPKPVKQAKAKKINQDILHYNSQQNTTDKLICDLLLKEICKGLPKAENKVWHGHPVWFIDGNPIVGYSKQKRGIRLMFWSGASFDETGLDIKGGKFKDASVFYDVFSDINTKDLKRWLKKSTEIEWDYKNIVKRKGVLVRLK
jgi:uncharacterized protein YdhG (YjbR/CyaY superfamily)